MLERERLFRFFNDMMLNGNNDNASAALLLASNPLPCPGIFLLDKKLFCPTAATFDEQTFSKSLPFLIVLKDFQFGFRAFTFGTNCKRFQALLKK